MPITATPDGRNTWILWLKVVSLYVENAICRYGFLINVVEVCAEASFIHPPGRGIGTVDSKVEVTIKQKDGREFSHLVILPEGEPENPLTDSELRAKFRNCGGMVLKEEKVERLHDAVMQMDKLDDVNELGKLTTF